MNDSMSTCANRLVAILKKNSGYQYDNSLGHWTNSLCEKCIRKCLIKFLRDEKLLVEEPDRGSSAIGFFGYRHKSSDVAFSFCGTNCLIECKVLKDKEEFQVRNGLIQLAENAQDKKWTEAILLVFDQRDDKYSFFEENEMTRKLIDLSQNLLEAHISVMRVYGDAGGDLQFEIYPKEDLNMCL